MAEPLRILIVRLSALGDVIHALPVLAALRARLPAAFIGWVVEEKPAAPLLAGHPLIDKLFVVPRRWLKSPRAVAKLRRELRAENFDVALDIQGLAKSAVAARLSGAPGRIGLARPDARELAPFLNNLLVVPGRKAPTLPRRLAEKLEEKIRAAQQPPAAAATVARPAPATEGIRLEGRATVAPPSGFFLRDGDAPGNEVRHVVDRNLAILEPLGIVRPPVAFPLPDFPDEQSRIDAWLAGQGLLPDSPGAHGAHGRSGGGERAEFVVINPGAGWPSKRWPPERFAIVARAIDEKWGLPAVVAWGGGEEKELADEIVERADAAAKQPGRIRPAPATTIPELAALLRRARLFVGSDTGPLHLAAAVDCPSVGLFGPMPAERNGPYGPAHAAVQRRRVPGTSRQRRRAGPEAMLAIEPENVLDACSQVLRLARPNKDGTGGGMG